MKKENINNKRTDNSEIKPGKKKISKIAKENKFDLSAFQSFLENDSTIKLIGLFKNQISALDERQAINLFKKHLAAQETARLTELAKTVLPELKKETDQYYGNPTEIPDDRRLGYFAHISSEEHKYLYLYKDHIVIKTGKPQKDMSGRYSGRVSDYQEESIPLTSIYSSASMAFHQYAYYDVWKENPDVTINYTYFSHVNKPAKMIDNIDANANVLKIYKYIVAHSGMSDIEKVRALEKIVIDGSTSDGDLSLAGYYYTKNHPSEASVIGRAVAGGIIAGPAGAVVGAISAANKNARIRSK